MCTITDGFKLCTCKTDIAKGMPYWELKRWDMENDIYSFEMGRCMNVTYTHSQKYFGDQLLSLLNHCADKTIFDFCYVPTTHDVLNMTFYDGDAAVKFEFYFDGVIWHIETQLSEHLNRKFITKQGRIGFDGCVFE